MSTPVEVLDAAFDWIKAEAQFARNAGPVIDVTTGGATTSAARIAGWSGLIAAGAYFLGTVPSRPEGAPETAIETYRSIAGSLGRAIDYLETHELTGRQLELQLDGIHRLTQIVERLTVQLKAAIAQQGVGASLGLEVMPSPESVNRATLERLANATARIAVWQRAHHGQVHGNLAEAQGRANAAAAALGSTSAEMAATTHEALRTVVQHTIPEVVHELEVLIREERALRRSADVDIRERFAQAVDRMTQRMGDLVRWLTTEVLPELETELRTETRARTQADRELRRGIATEADVRADTDAALLLQLAPLAAWMGSFGLHTTEKVRRHEQQIDQLDALDWSSLLAFTSVPALTALVMQLMPRVLEAGPAALGGLEAAAARLLGEV